MASSKVMASTSPTNQDMPRQTPLSSLLADLQQQNNPNTINDHSLSHQTLAPSMSMDDLLKSMYPDATSAPNNALSPFITAAGGGDITQKAVDEAWKDMVTGSTAAGEGMTLEAFLMTKTGAVGEEDVALIKSNNNNDVSVNSSVNSGNDQVGLGVGRYSVGAYNPQMGMGVAMGVIGNGNHVSVANNNSVGGDGRGILAVVPPAGGRAGRGKRRAVEEPPVDKATLQKQRRMIKNRESAARSRNRKQVQTNELESLVAQFEEENARLRKEEADERKERYKQLVESIIPVVEKQETPRRTLRRVNSW